MKNNCKENKGYFLIEIIVILAVLSVVAMTVITSFDSFQHRKDILELERVQKLIVQELSNMQLKSFYVRANHFQMRILQAGDGYTISNGPNIVKTVKLKDLGMGNAVLSAPSQTIQFLAGGTPTSYIRITLSFKQNSQLKFAIEIHPITGRIVVKDA